MSMVEKRWNDHTILIDEAWLTMAKELVLQQGIVATSRIAEIIEDAFNFDRFSELVSQTIVIAIRETEAERKRPRVLKIGEVKINASEIKGWAALPLPSAPVKKRSIVVRCNCRCRQPGYGCDQCGHPECCLP